MSSMYVSVEIQAYHYHSHVYSIYECTYLALDNIAILVVNININP